MKIKKLINYTLIAAAIALVGCSKNSPKPEPVEKNIGNETAGHLTVYEDGIRRYEYYYQGNEGEEEIFISPNELTVLCYPDEDGYIPDYSLGVHEYYQAEEPTRENDDILNFIKNGMKDENFELDETAPLTTEEFVWYTWLNIKTMADLYANNDVPMVDNMSEVFDCKIGKNNGFGFTFETNEMFENENVHAFRGIFMFRDEFNFVRAVEYSYQDEVGKSEVEQLMSTYENPTEEAKTDIVESPEF